MFRSITTTTAPGASGSEAETVMGLWAIKYEDEDEKWWVDVIVQDAPPTVAREKTDGRVVTVGFSEVTGVVVARRVSIPADALEDWPTDTAVILTRAELGPDTSLSTAS